MKAKAQSSVNGSPSRGSRAGSKEKIRRDRELDLYEDDYDITVRQDNSDSALPPITERSNHDNQGSPMSSRRLPVHERLYDPDYRKHRTANPEPEPVYNRDFKARLPKNLEHVTSKFMDQEYFEPKQEPQKEIEEFPQFKAYVPKQLEHVQSRHLNQEYFQKRQSPDPAMYDPHHSRFTARVPKGMEHVESRILDDKYFAPKTYPEREENYDNEFKAHIPKYLSHIESRLLFPKKPKAPVDDTDVFQTTFRAKPPRRFEHVESRILDPVYFEPKAGYMIEDEEEEQDTEFRSRPPRSLQHVEKRIYDPRYFQKKEQKPTSEDIAVQNMNTDFKAKLPKQLQHVKSKAFDQAMAMSPSQMSDTSVLEMKKKGQVVVIKVKKNTSPKPMPNAGYSDRLHADKMQDKDYYKQWRKEFDEQVRDIRGDKKDEDKKQEEEKGVKKSGKNSPTKKDDVIEEKEEKKERKPWKPRRPKRDVVDKSFFDSWVMTPTHIYPEQQDMFMANRRNVSEMWNNLATSIDKYPTSPRRIRSVERYY